jgi:hypothetical protein
MNIDKISEALDFSFKTMDLDVTTPREYLKELLSTLLEEGESFSGKRPFGNSGWENELAYPLIKTGVIEGTIHEEEDCCPDLEFEQEDYEAALEAMLETIFNGSANA